MTAIHATTSHRQSAEQLSRYSAKRKIERFNARTYEFDIEHSICDRPGLADQLVHPWLGHKAIALLIDVTPMSVARGLTIDAHPKADRGASKARAHDEINVACVEAVHDSPRCAL